MNIKSPAPTDPPPDLATQPHPLPRPSGEVPTGPYGPQHGHVDAAAGGADSSPFETESSDERKAAAEAPGQSAKGTGPTQNQ